MLDFLNTLDTQLFLFLNQFHSPFFDSIMLTVSYNKILGVTIILFLCGMGIYYFKKKFILMFIFCLATFGISDVISYRGFKENVQRLRPCHQEQLKEQVHLAGQKCWGGKYGFYSSHASNTFALSMFFWLLYRRRHKAFALLFAYAGLISYSRIYLAKHFPGDVFAGAIAGSLIAFAMYKLYVIADKKLEQKLTSNSI
jgi:undecaprenyl-diphosphatase